MPAPVTHFTTPQFWQLYNALPPEVCELADKNFARLKSDPAHPSLRFKSAMGILLVAGLYAKRLPPRNRRLWPIVGALVFCAILTIGETVYLRMYHEGRVHQHMERLPAST